MIADSSLFQADLESTARDAQWNILSFLCMKDLGIVMSLNRNFRQLLLSRNADTLWCNLCRRVWMKGKEWKDENKDLQYIPYKAFIDKSNRAEILCRLVCTHLQVNYKNIIVQTLLLLAHRPWSPKQKEQMIDTIVLYAKRGRDSSKAVWDFPLSLGVPVNRNLLKRLSVDGNEKKVFDYLVDDMKKALMSLCWLHFHGQRGRSMALIVQRMWALVSDFKARNNKTNDFIIYPKEEIRCPSYDQNAACFRLLFIETVVMPLAMGKVAIPLPINVLETIYEFLLPITREHNLSRNNVLYLGYHVGCYDYYKNPDTRCRQSTYDHPPNPAQYPSVYNPVQYPSIDNHAPSDVRLLRYNLYSPHEKAFPFLFSGNDGNN